MKTTNRVTNTLVMVLIVCVLALGVLVLTQWQVLFPEAGPITDPTTSVTSTQPNAQDGNTLRLPVILPDQNPDPGVAEFVLDAQAGQTNFFADRSTPTLGYNCSYLGPILRIRRGERVTIHVNNQLNTATTIHWHGLVVDGDQDGGPHQGIQAGESWNPSFIVDQPAATLWFHPHFSGTTANQVYAGLAGLIYIDDEVSDSMNLPGEYGVNDFPLIVQDRSFNRDGSFDYQTTMMGVAAGDTILINGTISPVISIGRGLVRFRILNASNAQNFVFTMDDGRSFQQIASDGGFLEKPITRQRLFLAPGERAEVVVDFSSSQKDTSYLMIGRQLALKINLTDDQPDHVSVPETLAEIAALPVEGSPKTRVFELQSMGIVGSINGKYFDMNRIDEEVRLNETEIWIIRNVGGMMQAGGHPFHVHSTQFQIISRNGQDPPPEERGFKDTVFVDVGEEVAILVRFSHPGIFMYHCHILEHEDNGMMGQFRVS